MNRILLSFCVLLCLGMPAFAQDLLSYSKAAMNGDADAAEYVGYSMLKSGDTQQAFQYLEIAARAGRPLAMAALGAMYSNGAGVEMSEQLALEWYKKAAAAGSQAGYEGYADCQRIIKGNLEESAEEYAKVSTPSARVCFILGYYYSLAGREEDYPKAIDLLKESMEAGYVYAPVILGIDYFEGNPPFKESDPQKAYPYVRDAYEHGDVLPLELKRRIYYILAQYYEEGYAGVAIDEGKAEMLTLMADNMTEEELLPFAYEGMMSMYDFVGQYLPETLEPPKDVRRSASASSAAVSEPAAKEPAKSRKPKEGSPSESAYSLDSYSYSTRDDKSDRASFSFLLNAAPVGFGPISSAQLTGLRASKFLVHNYSASAGVRLPSGLFIGVGAGTETHTADGSGFKQDFFYFGGSKYAEYKLIPMFIDLRWLPNDDGMTPFAGVNIGCANIKGLNSDTLKNDSLGLGLYAGALFGVKFSLTDWLAVSAGVKGSYTVIRGERNSGCLLVAPVVGLIF